MSRIGTAAFKFKLMPLLGIVTFCLSTAPDRCSAQVVSGAVPHLVTAGIPTPPPAKPEDELHDAAASENEGVRDDSEEESEDLDDDELDNLLGQDLTSLRRTSVAPSLDVEVSSVSRQKSTIGRSPAAVFVITEEMIRRSGYQSIPEVLRLAPGLQVARIDGNKWSISSRGEAGRFSEKLLVQIDGRSVYNPLFAGVLWDEQDVLLEDVLRIEVIRGPGATVWGANAVNGVINILTKPSSATHGTYALAGGGSLEQGFVGGRIGGRTRQGVDYRVWGKAYQRGDTDLLGTTPNDSMHQGRVGFRTDWNSGSQDSYSVQGQYHNGEQQNLGDRDLTGLIRFDVPSQSGNLMARWTRTYSKDRESSIQLYYDRFDRKTFGFGQQTNVIDVDFQNRFRLQDNHSMIWGLGYRSIFDRLTNSDPIPFIAADPNRFTVQRFSGFVQDEMTLLEDSLYFTLGSKFSHNTFSNFEVQPSARLLWLPSEMDAAWCSYSRAVRTPSRLSATGRIVINQPFPLGNFPLLLRGRDDNRSENLEAYEVGYRQQTNEFLSWDATAYFHKYDDLQALRLLFPSVGLPYMELFDHGSADGYGLEVSATAKLMTNWSLRAWYTFQRISYNESPPALPGSSGTSGSLPRNQVSLTNSFDLSCGQEFDLITRYVDNLPANGTPSYLAVDMRYSFRLQRHLRASIVGRNLFDRRHPEFESNRFTGDVATEVPRSVHAYLEWRR